MRIFILIINYFILISSLIGYYQIYNNYSSQNIPMLGIIIGLIFTILLTVPSIIYAHLSKAVIKERDKLKIEVENLNKKLENTNI